MLYLVSTPIGTISDISFRAVEILKSCDLILCEDTRHSGHLLKNYDIATPVKSYHTFNEASREEEIIALLRSGSTIALISDAGTPAIADPGERLVKKCHDEKIAVSPIPGACAAITALIASGLPTTPFQFIGFLPRKSSELKHTIVNALSYQGTTICYESPHRLLDTLEILAESAPKRLVTICREMTKKFEEIRRDTAEGHLIYWESKGIKGEIVIVIAGSEDENKSWESLSPEDHVLLVEKEYALPHKEALKLVAELRGIPKRDIYNAIVKNRTDCHHEKNDTSIP